MFVFFRTVAAFLLFFFAMLIIVMNWVCVILSIKNRDKEIAKSYSTVPLVSIILIYLMTLVYPYRVGSVFIMVPFWDPGTWWMFIAPVWLLTHWWKERHKNMTGDRNGRI